MVIKYKKVAVLEFFLLNTSDKDYFVTVKDHPLENQSFSIHQIQLWSQEGVIEATQIMKSNSYLMLTVFGFPIKKGFYKFDCLLIQKKVNREFVQVNYDAPIVKIQ